MVLSQPLTASRCRIVSICGGRFAPELGFPPGAFWLFRRSLRDTRCGPNDPPVAVSQAVEDQRNDGKDPQGTVAGIGWGPDPAEWGPSDKCGWQLWGEPFTLPVTQVKWPARYTGALGPATHSDPVLAARDVLECRQRLGALDLLAGMDSTTEQGYFSQLRAECARLVQDWPGTPNYAVGLNASDDKTAAPQLSLRLVSQLQLSALSPYLARVLGLYFVDTRADPGEEYQYCVTGVWANAVPPQVLSPGSAPIGALARGTASFDGLTITASPLISHLFAWQASGTITRPPVPPVPMRPG